MDYETKRPLMEQIDKSLLEHTIAAGTKEGGPDIVDAYRLQGLCEIHYYLKVEHDFKPNEVAALLQFADPLAVANECWEERDPEKGFPICELLNEINAYDRFPLTAPAVDAQQREEQMISALNAVLDQKMSEFHASLLHLGKEELIAQSSRIATMREAYNFMKDDFKYERGDVETLLRMENPLEFVADRWPSDIAGLFDMNDLVGEAISELNADAAAQEEEQPVTVKEGVDKKPSVLEQIKASQQEIRQSPPAQERPKGGEAR